MKSLQVKDYIETISQYSNLPLDLSIVVEPFGLFLPDLIFDGVLTGIYIEDILDQYSVVEKFDIYDALEILAFYASENEIKTIMHSLSFASKHGAAHSL